MESRAEALEFSSKFYKTLSLTVILIYNIKWKVNLRWGWYLPQYRIRWYITKLRRITIKSPKATVTRQERRGLCETAAETQSKARSWVKHRSSGKNLWYLTSVLPREIGTQATQVPFLIGSSACSQVKGNSCLCHCGLYAHTPKCVALGS